MTEEFDRRAERLEGRVERLEDEIAFLRKMLLPLQDAVIGILNRETEALEKRNSAQDRYVPEAVNSHSADLDAASMQEEAEQKSPAV